MALQPCRECGQQVSTEASSCPQCGVPNPTAAAPAVAKAAPAKRKRVSFGEFLAGIVVLIIVAVIVGNIGGEPFKPASGTQVTKVVAAQVDPQEAERKRVADAAEKARKDAECRQDLHCWAEKGTVAASVYCREKIEKLSNYSMKWTDAWYEPKFSHYRWSRKSGAGQGVVTYLGDKAQFQNGFGAYQNVVYTCDLNPEDKDHVILDVTASPGRLN